MVTELLLRAYLEGTGTKHSTPIFPCFIFVLKDGINKKPGDPNYDLFRLALECTAKRLYPNYANGDWSAQKSWLKQDRDMKRAYIESLSDADREALTARISQDPEAAYKLTLLLEDGKLVVDEAERPNEQFSTMGCLTGSATIDYNYKGQNYVESFQAAWDRLSQGFEVKLQPDGINLYMDTEGVEIYDVYAGYVKQRRMIRNSSDSWVKVTLDNNTVLRATPDHPFYTVVNGKGVVKEAAQLKGGERFICDARPGRLAVAQPCSHSFVRRVETYNTETEPSYDVTTETGYFMVNGIQSHNCRTANGFDVNALSSYKIAIQQAISGLPITMDLLSGAQKDGRGNICPVTIILPELAMIANRDVEVFMQVLEQKIEEAWSMLLERYEWICSQPAISARFTYENHVLAGYIPEEGVRSALQHGTIVIGQLGLAEALQLLIGKDHTSPEGMELAKRIEQLFKDKINEYRAKYKLNGGVYYSPSESLCHTALKKFRDKYGIIPNVSDKEFFTNSMHVPVWKRVNAMEKADIESQLTGYSSAGCIWYFETEVNIRYNIDGLEKCILYAIDKDIPYIGVNVTNDQCQDCGYLGDIPGSCPKCGSGNVMRLRRVTGYLSVSVENFNLGKQDEAARRVKHNG